MVNRYPWLILVYPLILMTVFWLVFAHRAKRFGYLNATAMPHAKGNDCAKSGKEPQRPHTAIGIGHGDYERTPEIVDELAEVRA